MIGLPVRDPDGDGPSGFCRPFPCGRNGEAAHRVQAAAAATPAQTGAPAPSHEPLWPFAAKPRDPSLSKAPFLTSYAPHPDSANGAAVVVCPGGAYGMLARRKEGEEPSLWLRSLGVHAFLLDYRLGPAFHHPAEMEDAQRAVRWVRANAKRFHLDPHRVGMLGFSAGGHLTATLATQTARAIPQSSDSVQRVSSRPDFQILIYPVISMEAPFTHRASRTNLLGRNPDAATLAFLSAETQVDARTPPAFIVHAEARSHRRVRQQPGLCGSPEAGRVPVEFMAFVQGTHAFGLAAEKNGEPGQAQLATWPAKCAEWLRARGFLQSKAPESRAGRCLNKASAVPGRDQAYSRLP